MIEQLRKTANHWVVALGVVLMALLSGCQSAPKFADAPQESGNVFHAGDLIAISAVPPSQDKTLFPDHTERISDDGKVTLQLIGSITAAGKTASQLQQEIHDLYVPRWYKELSVTVQGETRHFYVLGDVNSAGQKEYPGSMTVVKAIAVAGGFTEFGKRTNVQLTHGGHTQTVNVEKAIKDPRYDFPVYPGDRIFVKRKWL